MVSQKLYKCLYCDQSYKSRNNANRHIRRSHPGQDRIPRENPVKVAELAIKHSDTTPQALGAMLDHAVECKDGVCHYRDELIKRKDQIAGVIGGEHEHGAEVEAEPPPEAAGDGEPKLEPAAVGGKDQSRRWGFTN